MSLRKSLAAFSALLIVLLAALHFSARSIVERACPADKLAVAAEQADAMGESELALRLRVKGIFYSAAPRRFLEPASGTAALDRYLEGMNGLREGRRRDAEEHFTRVSSSDSPLLAARARIRLEEMRYRTGFPNADRIPF